MATKPTKIPTWATDADTTVEPSAGQKAAGWAAAQRPPARWMNWLLNTIYQWCEYLADGVFSSSSSAAAVEAQAGTGPALQVTPGTSTVAAERVGTQDAPTGAGLVGDRYTDSGGTVRTCREAGTPGTWRAVGALQTRQVLTASSGTYTTPAGCVAINVRCWGGGGAGGGSQGNVSNDASAGSGGGSGYFSEKLIVGPESAYSYVVGSGGAKGTGNANGGDGGLTSFSTLAPEVVVLAREGKGGLGGAAYAGLDFTASGGYPGGSPSNVGDYFAISQLGQPGIANGAGHNALGGQGGDSPYLGGGGKGGLASGFPGVPSPGHSYGAGGGGGASYTSTASPGGDGFQGLIIVDEYY